MNDAKISTSKYLLLGALSLVLVAAPGCAPFDWVKDKLGMGKGASSHAGHTQAMVDMQDHLMKEGQELASLDGVSIISDKSLERDFAQLIEENPQLGQILPLMPDARYNFLQGMVSQAVVDAYVVKNGIDMSEDYQKDLANMMRSVKRMLNTKYFGAANPVVVSDADVREYYDDNKMRIPELCISRGGVKAEGIMFSVEAEAKVFAAAAKGKDFAQVAKVQKLSDKVEDFNFVNEQSLGIHVTLRDKIGSLTKFPATEVVKVDDKTVWVVRATEKQETKYAEFEQVQAGLKQYIEKERRMAVFDKEITRLKEEYKVVVNDSYFKNKNEQSLAQTTELSDEMMDMHADEAVDVAAPKAA
ncbi:MAG TPA: peptidyl-prolyl cis-trans isomerase [Candidatus Babeliales bacterium]|nr:peptidyl-prolyl cis-trans isomerase [Candidatus Babeliales bacterium]